MAEEEGENPEHRQPSATSSGMSESETSTLDRRRRLSSKHLRLYTCFQICGFPHRRMCTKVLFVMFLPFKLANSIPSTSYLFDAEGCI